VRFSIYFLVAALTLSSTIASTIRFEGTPGWRISNSQATVTYNGITNNRPAGSISGTLKVVLWASARPYPSSGYRVAEFRLGQLRGGQRFAYYTTPSRPARVPKVTGPMHFTVVLEEYNGGYRRVDYKPTGTKQLRNGRFVQAPPGGGSGPGTGPGGAGNPRQVLGYVTLGDSEMRSFSNGLAYNVHVLAPGRWPVGFGSSGDGRAHGGDWLRMYGLPKMNARSFLQTAYALAATNSRPQVAWQVVRVRKGSRILMGYQWQWRPTSFYNAYRLRPVPPVPAPVGWKRWQSERF
jgi:hypothetical protein